MWRNGAQCGALQLPLPFAWVQNSLGEDFYKNVMIFPSQRCNIASMLVSSGKAPYPQVKSSHSSLYSGLNDPLVPGYERDGNVYDKFIAPKWLQVCTRLSVGLKQHANNLLQWQMSECENNQMMGLQINLQFFHYMLISLYKPPFALKMILCLHWGSISVNIRCIRDKPLLNYPLGRFIF